MIVQSSKKYEEKKKVWKRYLELRADYKNASKMAAIVASIVAIVVFTFMLYYKSSGKMQYDAGFVCLALSLIVLCIAIARYIQYYILLHDPGSELSEEEEIFTTGIGKTPAERIAKNRKTVYDTAAYLWLGLFLLAVAIFMWLLKADVPAISNNNGQTINDAKIEIDILQINDVYEIAGLDNGMIGGMARVAALKKQFLRQNKNTLLVMAGDFLSPSVFNSIRIDKRNLAGEQMIAAMNLAGVDLSIFGNHEFDLSFPVLQQRINESSCQWVASNVYHKMDSGRVAFEKNKSPIPKFWKKTFTDEDGTSLTLGFMGLTVLDNKGNPEYVAFDSTLLTAKKMYAEHAPSCDAVIAITHQDLGDDRILARALPGLTAIIGGHEHDMQFEKVGNVYITKAHSNAKSVFHLKIVSDRMQNPQVSVTPDLLQLDTTIQPDFLTKSVCDKWMEKAMDFFTDSGFSPEKVICKNFNSVLDGRYISIRTKKTNLTRLITDAMLAASKSYRTDLAIMNSGSIRIDDQIDPPLTEYAILRALPYGGAIRIAKMKGSFIKALLDSAAQLKTDGAFLQYSDNLNPTGWKLNNSGTIKDAETYTVAIADYLIEGKQEKLTYVNKKTPGIEAVYDSPSPVNGNLYDIRRAVINYVEAGCNNQNFMDRYK